MPNLRHSLALGGLLLPLAAPAARAQTRTLTLCTPDALAVCAELRLSASPGLFEIALRTIGSTVDPLLPVSVYNLVFDTGGPRIIVPVSMFVPPVGVGGAVVSDASDWEVFDTGPTLFLSALSNRGVGGCVRGADVEGFGQAAKTCGAGQFATFRFATVGPREPDRFDVLDLEAVGLSDRLPGASCGGPGAACVITADTRAVAAPEPRGVALLSAGLLSAGIIGAATHRRRA